MYEKKDKRDSCVNIVLDLFKTLNIVNHKLPICNLEFCGLKRLRLEPLESHLIKPLQRVCI